MDFMRIVLSVKKLLPRQRAHQLGSRPNQLALRMKVTHQRNHEKALFFVPVKRREPLLWHVIANVVIARLAHRSDSVHSLINPISCAESINARGISRVAQENTALHSRRPRYSGDP